MSWDMDRAEGGRLAAAAALSGVDELDKAEADELDKTEADGGEETAGRTGKEERSSSGGA
jgi:hypothetical protein